MAGDHPDGIKRGDSSLVSPPVSTLLAADAGKVPEGLLQQGNYLPSVKRVPLARYWDREFAAREQAYLWQKVWQFACREEDIPEVGDRYCYEVGNKSWIVLRSAPGEIRAFANSCLHRGTALCNGNGWAESIRCPFHAWEWNLDGSLKNIPSRWDFPQVQDDAFRLPEARVETWGGFIFINPDPQAKPLAAALGVLPQHFAGFKPQDRYTAFHLRKKVRANWKVVMEAFLESYHVVETHPESLGFTGDASTRYDIWDDGEGHISRLFTPQAVPSPHLGDQASVEQAVNMMYQAIAMGMPGVPVPQYDSASPLPGRAQIAQWRRQMMGAALNRDFSASCDAEMIDSIQYFMFPNFCPWYGEGLPLVYQFLPLGDNPDESLMSVRLTAPVPGGGLPRPPSAPIRHLDFDEAFNTAPEIGLLSMIFDQDMSNLPVVQRGLKAAAAGRQYASLGRYQEQRIVHFHEVLERALQI